MAVISEQDLAAGKTLLPNTTSIAARAELARDIEIRDAEPDAPSVSDTIISALRRENLLFAALSSLSQPDAPPPVDGYSAFIGFDGAPPDIQGYEGFEESFVNVRSPAEAQQKKLKIDQEKADLENITSGAFGIVAAMAAGILSPENLIPGFGIARATRGGKLLVKVLGVAAEGAFAAGSAEAGLHALQETRTARESLFAVGGAAILSGILGGLASTISSKETNELLAMVDSIESNPEGLEAAARRVFSETNPGEFGKLDIAAQERMITEAIIKEYPDVTKLVTNKAVDTLGALFRLTPSGVTARSQSPFARFLSAVIPQNRFLREANAEGVTFGIPVELRIKQWTLFRRSFALATGRETHKAYRIAGGKLSRNSFMEEVSRAVRNGLTVRTDRIAGPEGEFITRAAKAYDEILFKPMREDLLKLKIIDKSDLDLKGTAIGHIYRDYSLNKILEDPDRFIDVMAESILRNPESGIETIAQARKIANEGLREIRTTNHGSLPTNGVMTPGPLKKRQLLALDSDIDEFLENNIEILAKKQVEMLAGPLELVRTFDKAPDPKLAALDAKIELAEKAFESGDPKAALKEVRDALDIAEINRGLSTAEREQLGALNEAFVSIETEIKKLQTESITAPREGSGFSLEFDDFLETPRVDLGDRLNADIPDVNFKPGKNQASRATALRRTREYIDLIKSANTPADLVASGVLPPGTQIPKIVADVGVVVSQRRKAPLIQIAKDGEITRTKLENNVRGLSDIRKPVKGIPDSGRRHVWAEDKPGTRTVVLGRNGKFIELGVKHDSTAWTAAHEIGHVAEERLGGQFRKLRKKKTKWENMPEEQFAESFALRMLDPEKWDEVFGGIDDEVTRATQRAFSAENISVPGERGVTNEVADEIARLRDSQGGVKAKIRELRQKAFNNKDADVDLVQDVDEALSTVEQLQKEFIRLKNAAKKAHKKRTRDIASLNDEIKHVESDYQELLENATPKEQEKLIAEQKRTIEAIETMRDRILGVSGVPQDPSSWSFRMSRAVKNANIARFAGSFTPSSIADIGSPVMIAGFKPMARAWLALATDTANVIAKSGEAAKASAIIESTGIGIRQAALADISDLGGRLRQTRPERLLEFGATSSLQLSLLGWWNAGQKGIASFGISDITLRRVIKVAAGGGTTKDIAELANQGISKEMAIRIAAQSKHFEKATGGLMLPRTDLWGDAAAAQRFEFAVLRDVEDAIVTPGIGDRPKFADTAFGGMVFQFRAFSAGATNSILLSGLQRADAQFMAGVMAMVAMGVVSYAATEVIRGRAISSDPGTILKNGIDRSGVLGILNDIDKIVEIASSGNLGLTAILSNERTTRFRNVGILGAIGGAGAGGIEDATNVVQSLFRKGGLTQGDVNRVRRFMWYQNNFGFARIFDEFSVGLGESLGATDKGGFRTRVRQRGLVEFD